MPPIVGTTIAAIPSYDPAVGSKVPLRDYFWDLHNPAYLSGLVAGRPGILSWKERTGAGIFPAVDFTNGKYDNDYNAFLDDALSLGMKNPLIATDHEFDAKAAAAGGTPQQISDSLLHASKLCRQHPKWASSGARVTVIATGWNLPNRGQQWMAILADCDVIGLDPYATMTATLDAEAGPDMDWIAKNFPGKEVQFGEWGVPKGKPGRAQEMLDTVALFSTPRYKALTAAYWWEGSGFETIGTPEQSTMAQIIKASLVSTPDYAALYAADEATIKMLTSQATVNAAAIASMQAKIAAAKTALG